MVMVMMNIITIPNLTLIILNQSKLNSKFQHKKTLIINYLRKVSLQKDYINGLLEDGNPIEMIFLIMIKLKRILPTIGGHHSHCNTFTNFITKPKFIIFSLHNKLVLSLLRAVFDTSSRVDKSHHEGLNGVKSHENALFLYKSNQSDYVVKTQQMDYFLLLCLGGWVTGFHQFLFLPLIVIGL
jgi:hypothetical protein